MFLLVVAGLITISRLGRPATAVAAAALWPEMLALSALRHYPFLDERTSTFLFAVTAVVAAIGVGGLGALRIAPWPAPARLRWPPGLALAGRALRRPVSRPAPRRTPGPA